VLDIQGLSGCFGQTGDDKGLARVAAAVDSHADSPSTAPVALPGCQIGGFDAQIQVLEDLAVAVVGNLDWLDVEFADVQSKSGATRALAHAYRRHGSEFLARIGGRFAVAVWDATQQRGLVATDRFAQVPVYWSAETDHAVSFGPTTAAVNKLRSRPASLSDQGLFNYLYFHMVPSPGSIFEGIAKLRPGQVLFFDQRGARAERYWQPDFREHLDGSLQKASEEMMGLLSSSVSRLAKGVDAGAFLSGGLDSSTVTGLLASQREGTFSYSIGFDAEGYDEIGYARIASERFGTRFQTYYVTPDDVTNALPHIASAYDEPFGNSSALPAYFCARLAAADGRKRLLAGDGGDELFAGNERYAKQEVFERYSLLPGWLRKGLLEPLIALAPSMVPKISKARSYIQQANVPLPERLQAYNFLERLALSDIFPSDWLDAVDVTEPSRLEREIYHAPSNASRLNRMLYLDWHHTLADNDLRKVNRMCQLAGIEVEYPMLDDRLVEFSTRISSRRKMLRGKLRGFYKEAVREFLPAEIISKRKQGFGLPFGVWMANDAGLQTLAADHLSALRSRHFIRPEFLDNLIDLHRSHHAGYYGEMIWILVMLALWLDAHEL
jgi:asparagine synthase (glutamine-hydrolysing)